MRLSNTKSKQVQEWVAIYIYRQLQCLFIYNYNLCMDMIWLTIQYMTCIINLFIRMLNGQPHSWLLVKEVIIKWICVYNFHLNKLINKKVLTFFYSLVLYVAFCVFMSKHVIYLDPSIPLPFHVYYVLLN